MEWTVLVSMVLATISVSSWTDLSEERIPNLLVSFLAIFALVFRLSSGGGESFFMGIQGLLMGLFLFLPLWLFRVVGAGDAKLTAALGACLGPAIILEVGAWSMVFGGVLAVVVLVGNGSFWFFLKGFYHSTLRLLMKEGDVSDWKAMGKTPVPFAPVIALASLWVLGRLS